MPPLSSSWPCWPWPWTLPWAGSSSWPPPPYQTGGRNSQYIAWHDWHLHKLMSQAQNLQTQSGTNYWLIVRREILVQIAICNNQNIIKAAYLKQWCNTEVGWIQIVPSFPLWEHDGAYDQVHHHHPDADSGGHQHLIWIIIMKSKCFRIHLFNIFQLIYFFNFFSHDSIALNILPSDGPEVYLTIDPLQDICEDLSISKHWFCLTWLPCLPYPCSWSRGCRQEYQEQHTAW